MDSREKLDPLTRANQDASILEMSPDGRFPFLRHGERGVITSLMTELDKRDAAIRALKSRVDALETRTHAE